jgi:hypothetical protein
MVKNSLEKLDKDLDVLNILKTLRKVKFMQKMFFTKQIRQLMMKFEENVIYQAD